MTHFIEFVKISLLAFTSLFPVVNPIGTTPIFFGLTRQYPQSAQKLLARKIAAYGFGLLAFSLVFGTEILGFFGISLVVVQIAGGLIVAATGWNLLQQKEGSADKNRPTATVLDAMEHAFYPLTLPITIGPGCISIAVTLGAHLRNQAVPGLFGGIVRTLLGALTGLFFLCLAVLLCYASAGRMIDYLGKSGATIVTRLSAFILFAIGVQILWNGLEAGMPSLFSTLPPQ